MAWLWCCFGKGGPGQTSWCTNYNTHKMLLLVSWWCSLAWVVREGNSGGGGLQSATSTMSALGKKPKKHSNVTCPGSATQILLYELYRASSVSRVHLFCSGGCTARIDGQCPEQRMILLQSFFCGLGLWALCHWAWNKWSHTLEDVVRKKIFVSEEQSLSGNAVTTWRLAEKSYTTFRVGYLLELIVEDNS